MLEAQLFLQLGSTADSCFTNGVQELPLPKKTAAPQRQRDVHRAPVAKYQSASSRLMARRCSKAWPQNVCQVRLNQTSRSNTWRNTVIAWKVGSKVSPVLLIASETLPSKKHLTFLKNDRFPCKRALQTAALAQKRHKRMRICGNPSYFSVGWMATRPLNQLKT